MSLDITLKDNDYVVYECNITHNLGTMAEHAGLYSALWRSSGNAEQLVKPLTRGLCKLIIRPEYYKQFNSPNGWGMYEQFLPHVAELLEACLNHPNATMEVSR